MEGLTDLDAGVGGTGPAALRVTQQDVLRFEVSVQDPFALQHLHGLSHLLQEQTDGVLAQGAFSCGHREELLTDKHGKNGNSVSG